MHAHRTIARSRVSGLMSRVAMTEMMRMRRLMDATWKTACGAGSCKA